MLLLLVLATLAEGRQPPKEHCQPGGSSLQQTEHNLFRVGRLVVDRSLLQDTQPTNEYRPVGSDPSAFQLSCLGSSFDFSQPAVFSHGLSSDGRPFGQHFLHSVPQLPTCHVTFSQTVLLMNRDWFRNIWHRVANDIFPAFQALRRWNLLEERQSLHVVHLDWARPSFTDLYELLAPNATFLRDLPESQRFVCFDDAFFILSRPWYDTWPEGGSQNVPVNPEVQEFGRWIVKRAGLDHIRTPFQQTGGSHISIGWISRNTSLHGNRAFKNEDQVLPEIQQALGPQVTIRKLQLEGMTLQEQMVAIRGTDILFGMHGAGFTHILWLPSHAVVFEVLPKDFSYLFYERVAKISGLRYISWQNDVDEDMVEWSWRPHTKFTNLILHADKLLPKFRAAIAMLTEKQDL